MKQWSIKDKVTAFMYGNISFSAHFYQSKVMPESFTVERVKSIKISLRNMAKPKVTICALFGDEKLLQVWTGAFSNGLFYMVISTQHYLHTTAHQNKPQRQTEASFPTGPRSHCCLLNICPTGWKSSNNLENMLSILQVSPFPHRHTWWKITIPF